MNMSLEGVKIIDLSRILAGPFCTQLLGDLGAQVIKVEQPGRGDDTRKWGPPFLKGADGKDTQESAYYLCANRNKASVSLDISTAQGQAAIKDLLQGADVLVENFKVGGLAKYGLSYEDLKEDFPGLVYCSITGFGQTGPYAGRAGYDYLAQGMGGIMSVTGEPEGEPMKVGVAFADTLTGMYATVGILAALRHRDRTGEGQQIDLALLDCQLAGMINVAQNYLTSGQSSPRLGNAHPNIVPYRVYAVSDGHLILAVGNDSQFAKWAEVAGRPDLAADDRFKKNADRLTNRAFLEPQVEAAMMGKSRQEWLALLEQAGVPCGPVNSVDQVFADPQVQHRHMRIEMDHPASKDGKVALVANPLKLSKTPVQYRHSPPVLKKA